MIQKSNAVDPSIFRAYDIRGIVGKTLTEESVYLIGKAVGSLLSEQGESKIAIARDGRTSGGMLSEVLTEGLLSTGCDVLNLGMVPTPLLYFATHTLTTSGMMLTGSHNPSDYNGLKIVIKQKTLAEQEIQHLYQRIIAKQFVTGEGLKQSVDIIPRYSDLFTTNIRLARPLNIVIDAGNGVTGMLAPSLFRALGCTVHELFCEVDGTFPNHHPDPGEPKNLQALIHAVNEVKADIGLAFDGDGDRLGVVTGNGEVICPDRLLMIYAQSILAKHKQAKIIFDVKCTNHLDNLIREWDGEPIMWKTGHSLIKAKMAETQAILAGEMSGHFFFKDRWYGFDDALYAGARLLEILAEQSCNQQIFTDLPNSVNTHELKVFVADEEKFNVMQELVTRADFRDAKEVTTIDGLRVNFADGWGLVRPSNTTPYLILRFEAINESILNNIQVAFREWMLSVRPELILPF